MPKLPPWSREAEFWELIGYCPECNEFSWTSFEDYEFEDDAFCEAIIERCPICGHIFDTQIFGDRLPETGEKPVSIVADKIGAFTREHYSFKMTGYDWEPIEDDRRPSRSSN